MKRKICIVVSALLLVMCVFSSTTSIYATDLSCSGTGSDFDSAVNVNLGNSYNGNLSNSSDKDCYKIKPTSEGYVRLKFKHTYQDEYGNWRIRTYECSNGAFTEMSSTSINLRDDEIISIPSIGARASGTYYVIVENSHSVVGIDYTLATSMDSSGCFEKELNNVYGTATDIIPGSGYVGNTNSSSDKDYYRVKPLSKGYIRLKFKHTYQDEYGNWRIYTYESSNGSYTELSSTSINLRDDEIISIPSIGAKESSTYYIMVENSHSVTGIDYTLATSMDSSACCEKELNNVYGTATDISMGSSYVGNANSNSDKDYYRIQSSAGSTIRLKFRHKYRDEYGGWRICTYESSNGTYKELSSTYVGLRDDEIISIPSIGAKANRTYFVRVNSSGGVIGIDYAISVTGKCSSHSYESVITKATLESDGKIVKKCRNCGNTTTSKISRPKTFSMSNTSMAYDGKEKNPSLTVKNAKGKIIAAENYSLTKSNGRIDVGKYSYNVEFKGDYYSGTKAVSFKIVPKKAILQSVVAGEKSITVKASAEAGLSGGDGYQIAYRKSGASTWSYQTTTAQSTTVSKLITGKKYQVNIRVYKKVDNENYYGAWSGIKTSAKVKKKIEAK